MGFFDKIKAKFTGSTSDEIVADVKSKATEVTDKAGDKIATAKDAVTDK